MIALMLVTAVLVFVRGIQQLNVVGGHIFMASATSYAIALAEVYFVADVAVKGMSAVPFVGTGGAIGVAGAIMLHPKLKRLINGKS